MYNLLVTGKDFAWNEGSYVWKMDRVLESPFTKALIRKRLADLAPHAISTLKSLPTLFIYENGTSGEPQVGTIKSVERRNEDLRIVLELDETDPVLTAQFIKKMRWDLQIEDFEFGRTHWAVKESDLHGVLEANGIRLASRHQPAPIIVQPTGPISVRVSPGRLFSDNFGDGDTAVVAMAFTDVVGSTNLKERLGDATANKLIEEHFQILRTIIQELRDAQDISTSGDSMLLIFARPSTAVTFALRAQRALKEWTARTRESVEIRIGVHLGEVQFFRHPWVDVRGAHVDRCARIMAEASGGRIYVSKNAYDSASTALKGILVERISSVEWRKRGLFELKGVNEPVELWEVFDPSVFSKTEWVSRPSASTIQNIIPAETAADDGATITLLTNLIRCNWRKFQIVPGSGGSKFQFLILEGEPSPGFEADENYLLEDIDALVEQGFLRESVSSIGSKIYSISRAGDIRVKSLSGGNIEPAPLKITAKKDVRYYPEMPQVRYYICELWIENPNVKAAENLAVEFVSAVPSPHGLRPNWEKHLKLPKFPFSLSRADSSSTTLNPKTTARFEFFKVPREGQPTRFQTGGFDSFIVKETEQEFSVGVSAIDQPYRLLKFKVVPTLDSDRIPSFEIQEQEIR